MLRFLFLSIIILIAAAFAIVAFTPLSFVLERTGISDRGAVWAEAEGTILNGQISGLELQGQKIGDVSLKLRPASLLRLTPAYDVNWEGESGQGTGLVALQGQTLIATELILVQELKGIETLAAPLKAIGGHVRLDGGEVTVNRDGCVFASGEVSTNVLEKAAAQYGRQFGLLSGPLSCVEGALDLALEGRSDAADTVDFKATIDWLGRTSFDASIVTQDDEVRYVLKQIGFVESGDALTYAKSR